MNISYHRIVVGGQEYNCSSNSIFQVQTVKGKGSYDVIAEGRITTYPYLLKVYEESPITDGRKKRFVLDGKVIHRELGRD